MASDYALQQTDATCDQWNRVRESAMTHRVGPRCRWSMIGKPREYHTGWNVELRIHERPHRIAAISIWAYTEAECLKWATTTMEALNSRLEKENV